MTVIIHKSTHLPNYILLSKLIKCYKSKPKVYLEYRESYVCCSSFVRLIFSHLKSIATETVKLYFRLRMDNVKN